MEVKSESVWEEHYPHDSIAEDIVTDVLYLEGRACHVVSTETRGLGDDADINLAQLLCRNAESLRFLSNLPALLLDFQGKCLTAISVLEAGIRNVMITSADPVHIQRTAWPTVFLNCPSRMASVRAISVTDADWQVQAEKAKEATG
jgi:hypothetical protein